MRQEPCTRTRRNAAGLASLCLWLAACTTEAPPPPPPYAPPYQSRYAPPPPPPPPRRESPPAWTPEPPPTSSYGHEEAWRDGAHHRDRMDAVEGWPEFAAEEARIRAALDEGVRRGWLDRNDYLIFGRQLHQTELHEARERRLHGDRIPRAERELIRANLEELRRQIDETRRGG